MTHQRDLFYISYALKFRHVGTDYLFAYFSDIRDAECTRNHLLRYNNLVKVWIELSQ